MVIYIIEHLEPELWEWCEIEYESISNIVGRENLWFTNVKNEKDRKKLEGFGKVSEESIRELKLENICILDPEANKTLTTEDIKQFDYLIFGGILGDYPPRKRTKEELTRFFPKAEQRNIGKEQFSTDNAVKVCRMIETGKKFEDIPLINRAEIEINDVESFILPFSYINDNGKPFMSKKIIEYLKRKKGF
jgi:ribosome biogenesis SPOUT family RNA methylase Rps3